MGVCNSLSSVSLQQRSEMVDQCYRLVTTQFYFGKQRITHPWGMMAGWSKKERPQSILASSFYTFLSAPHWACPVQTGLAKKGACLFHLKFSLQSMDFPLFHFHGLFPKLPPFWTTFSCSNYLTVPKTQKWKCYLLSHVRLCVIPWSVRGIIQARILEWVAIPFSRGSSQPKDQTQISCIAGGSFTSWATRETQECWSG